MISIIIPTRNSELYIENTLSAICKSFNGYEYEIIISDNESADSTLEIANSYNCKILNISGCPPQVNYQKNKAAQSAIYKYLLFLDHDMVVSSDFAESVSDSLNKFPLAEAFYIKENIITASKFLTNVRNFERRYYEETPVDAIRIILKDVFFKIGEFDIDLSDGPGDWDFDIRCRINKIYSRLINANFTHDESRMTLFSYLMKKGMYSKGMIKYKKKWADVKITRKYLWYQFSPINRIFLIFFSNNTNILYTLKNMHLYVSFVFIRLFIQLRIIFSRL